jgi:hypothetical protein
MSGNLGYGREWLMTLYPSEDDGFLLQYSMFDEQ